METETKLSENTQATAPTSERKGNQRKRRIITFIVVSLLNVGLLAVLWSQLLTPAPNASDPLLGKPAPDFTLAALRTGTAPMIHLASLKGKLVVVNFWASWCDPCKQEAPLLQAASQRTQAQGIVFIGIDYQDKQSDGLSFLQQMGITYTNAADANGATAINYGVTGVPETFFIDRHGTIVSIVRKQITAQVLQSNITLLTH